MSVVVRVLLDQAADGDLVGLAEALDTGERRPIGAADDLTAWLQLAARQRLDVLDDERRRRQRDGGVDNARQSDR
jgi:hypothetical protein